MIDDEYVDDSKMMIELLKSLSSISGKIDGIKELYAHGMISPSYIQTVRVYLIRMENTKRQIERVLDKKYGSVPKLYWELPDDIDE